MNIGLKLTTIKNAAVWLVAVIATAVQAAPVVTDYDAVPPLLSQSASPMIMLAMSNDHQLFYKSFTDYDDIDGDGVLDTTYSNDIEYSGYFDSYKCYSYSGTLFEPVSITADKYCNASASTSVQWSGNFLNWATMTRIDQVRKVLYGGYRSTDSDESTVLERSYLPNDAHSFAKFYNGSDLKKLTPFDVTVGKTTSADTGLTLCNTTYSRSSGRSQDVTAPPLLRVVAGNYSLWAANERYQCYYSDESGNGNGNNSATSGIYAYSGSPAKSNRAVQTNAVTVADYIVRVKACVSASLVGQEDCKQYPDGNYKPIGILQTFGDDGVTLWGLMTGSYKKNKSGGVLRKNIAPVTNEINVLTDGTFIDAPENGGIIDTINRFKIANYQHDPGYYNDKDNCAWAKNTFADGTCTNWGNPFAELMLECYRYFAGAGPNSSFNADDTSVIPGLKTQTSWSNPQDASTACAHLNLIAFNTSTVSYDGDNLSGVSNLNTSKTANQLTNAVGTGEGIDGNYFFVGENGTDNDQLCTAKKIDNLGDVKGVCPNAPRLEGTYKAAGIAYHARTVDLRTDIPDRQSVTTYGVALAPALPKVILTAPSNNKKVTILPACRNDGIKGNCGLVDFKVISQTVTSTKVSGSFYVNWEDSEQGGDYDQDMSGTLKYELTSTGIKITTKVIGESTVDKMGFGFVISGTTNDGFHSISGIEGYSLYGCSNCQASNAAKSKNFTLGDSTVAGAKVALLEAPLFYASKWGGFNDVNNNTIPDLPQEWDRKNNRTGAFGADGIPDTYFFAVNPKELKRQLTSILVDILERTAAGTAASVVSNTGAGEGALYQALYNPRTADKKGENFINWVGTLNALFIDRYGYMREDSAAPFGTLSNADNIVKVFYDEGARRTRIQRYAFNQGGQQGAVLGVAVDVSEIKPIWSAHKALAEVADYTTQRASYTSMANSARYILTGIDSNNDGVIVGGDASTSEVVPFTSASFSDTLSPTPNYRLLGIENLPAATAATNASQLVNFIRGQEGITGFRSRSLDITGSGTLMPWLLGDIVHSSPVSVGRAMENYDVVFGDETYRLFRQKYQNRRQVVYVGSNDGMLHAFNGGFYDPDNSSYTTSKNGETAHPLGAELWAYVPYNALPHLQWLAQPNYPHVYYVDGPVKSFDVNVFDADDDHPGGWGTIIVGSMRLGGGEYTLDPNSDPDGNNNDDISLRSSYFVFDVTNPEVPPKLLIEFTDPKLGYTLSDPTVVKRRTVGVNGDFTTPGDNDWFLVFGSGPQGSDATTKEEALRLGQSNQQSLIYSINLKTLDVIEKDTGITNSFVGGITAASWTRKYSDDAVYFGLVEGTVDAPRGRLMRGVISDVIYSANGLPFNPVLADYSQPFSATPLLQRDLSGNTWIYAGTGRFLVVEDNFSSTPQSFYAIKEFDDVSSKPAVGKFALVNTTDIESLTNGDLLYQRNDVNIHLNTGENVETFAQLSSAVEDNRGWYFNFKRARARNTTKATVADQSLVFTEYQPSGLQCEPEGNGYLHAPHMFVGVAAPFAPLGTDSNVKFNDAELVLDSISLGFGSPSTPYIHLRVDGSRAAVVQTSTGEISWTKINSAPGKGARQSWRELEITW